MITYEQALNAINTLREKFRKDGESVNLFGKENDQSFLSAPVVDLWITLNKTNKFLIQDYCYCLQK